MRKVSNIKSPTCVSLFAGAGGMDIGLELAGFESVFVNELEETFHRTLVVNQSISNSSEDEVNEILDKEFVNNCWKRIPESEKRAIRNRVSVPEKVSFLKNAYLHQGDIRGLTSSFILEKTKLRVGELDLLAGGPPCQPFSRAGKRETVGIADGRLFLEMTRLASELKPRFVLFENVKGLAQSRTEVVNYQCDKCKHRGILPLLMRDNEVTPKCKCGSSKLKLWKSNNKGGSLEMIVEEFERIGYIVNWKVLNAADYGAPQIRERIILVASRDNDVFDFPKPTHSKNPKDVLDLFNANELRPWVSMKAALLQEENWKKINRNAVLWVKNVVRPHDEPVTWNIDRPSPTIGAHQAAKLAIATKGVPEEQLYRQQWHVLGRRQSDTPPVHVDHEMLTDVELQLLQTFPRNWFVVGTRMERAFQIGNAVPVILAQAIGKELNKSIAGKRDKIADSAS